LKTGNHNEWFALPLITLADSKQIGNDPFNEMFHPIAVRLLDKCDAVLRVGGASTGTNQMVSMVKEKGENIFYSLEETPQS